MIVCISPTADEYDESLVSWDHNHFPFLLFFNEFSST